MFQMKIKNVALAIAAAGLLLSSQSVLASSDSGVNASLDTGAGSQSTGGVIAKIWSSPARPDRLANCKAGSCKTSPQICASKGWPNGSP